MKRLSLLLFCMGGGWASAHALEHTFPISVEVAKPPPRITIVNQSGSDFDAGSVAFREVGLGEYQISHASFFTFGVKSGWDDAQYYDYQLNEFVYSVGGGFDNVVTNQFILSGNGQELVKGTPVTASGDVTLSLQSDQNLQGNPQEAVLIKAVILVNNVI